MRAASNAPPARRIGGAVPQARVAGAPPAGDVDPEAPLRPACATARGGFLPAPDPAHGVGGLDARGADGARHPDAFLGTIIAQQRSQEARDGRVAGSRGPDGRGFEARGPQLARAPRGEVARRPATPVPA